MTIWREISEGVGAYDRSYNNAQEREQRGFQVQEQRDTRTGRRIEADAAREFASPPAGGADPNANVAAPTPGVEGAPATPGAAPTSALAGGAPAQQATERGFLERIGGALGLYQQQSQRDPDVQRDTMTGQGVVPATVQDAAMRRASGNRDQPTGPRDLNAYMDYVARRYTQAGLGDRVPEAHARIMQNIHSATVRGLSVANAAAASGDLERAANIVARSYSFIPDGNVGRVSRGADGSFSVGRFNTAGEQVGTPFVVTPESLRDLYVGASDPAALSTLFIQRETRALARDALTEQSTHNRRTEAISAGSAARADARETRRDQREAEQQAYRNRRDELNDAARERQLSMAERNELRQIAIAERGPAPTPPTLGDVRAAGELVTDEMISAATRGQTGAGNRPLDPAQVRDVASSILLNGHAHGVTPQTAATAAAALSSGVQNPAVRVGRDDQTGRYVALVNGVLVPLSGRGEVLARSYAERYGMGSSGAPAGSVPPPSRAREPMPPEAVPPPRALGGGAPR